MSDPFTPGIPFAEIASTIGAEVETVHAQRAWQFLRDYPEVDADVTVIVASQEAAEAVLPFVLDMHVERRIQGDVDLTSVVVGDETIDATVDGDWWRAVEVIE